MTEVITHTAASRGIKRLYHYQAHNIDWLRQLLIDGQMYFSQPNSFNDPWDCKPWYDPAVIDDPAAFERHLHWYKRVTKAVFPWTPDDEIERRTQFYRTNRDEFKIKVREISLGMGDAINDDYRVYCLSTHSTAELMWAHYARGHTGVCLEFDATDKVIGSALQVQYLESYPAHDLTDDSEAGNLLQFVAKSHSWSYEDEYRLVAQEKKTGVPRFETLLTERSLLTFAPTALLSIIVGCLMPTQHRDEIRKLLGQCGRDIGLQHVVRAPDRYVLSIEKL